MRSQAPARDPRRLFAATLTNCNPSSQGPLRNSEVPPSTYGFPLPSGSDWNVLIRSAIDRTSSFRMHIGAMVLDRLFADPKVMGDPLVGLAGQNLLEHVPFTFAQSLEPLDALSMKLSLLVACLGLTDRPPDRFEQILVVHRLLEEIEGAGLQRAHSHTDVRVPRHDDDREVKRRFNQFGLQFEATRARHAHIYQQTTDTRIGSGSQKSLCGIEGQDAEADQFKKPQK